MRIKKKRGQKKLEKMNTRKKKKENESEISREKRKKRKNLNRSILED